MTRAIFVLPNNRTVLEENFRAPGDHFQYSSDGSVFAVRLVRRVRVGQSNSEIFADFEISDEETIRRVKEWNLLFPHLAIPSQQ